MEQLPTIDDIQASITTLLNTFKQVVKEAKANLADLPEQQRAEAIIFLDKQLSGFEDYLIQVNLTLDRYKEVENERNIEIICGKNPNYALSNQQLNDHLRAFIIKFSENTQTKIRNITNFIYLQHNFFAPLGKILSKFAHYLNPDCADPLNPQTKKPPS